MTVVTRLTRAFTLLFVAFFGLFGWWLVQRESEQLHAVAQRDVALLARSLDVAFEHALRDRRLGDVQPTLDEVRRIDDRVTVRIYDHLGDPIATTHRDRSALTEAEAALVESVRRTGVGAVGYDATEDPAHVVYVTPLTHGPMLPDATLVVAQPLDDVYRDLEQTKMSILAGVIALTLAVFVVLLWLGRVHIQRPLRQLAAAARAIQSDDMEAALPAGRTGDIGALARDFAEMRAALVRARRELDEEVVMRSELQLALQRADRLAAVGQLSAGLAHDIGSPLQVMVGRSRQLLSQAEDPERVRRTATILCEQGERISRIIDQLLGFARRSPLRRERISLSRPVEAVVDLLQHEAKRRRVSLRLRPCEAPILARVSSDAVQQIVFNLTMNALQATPPGGIVEAGVDCRPEGHGPFRDGACRVLVSDTGGGIDAQVRDTLFDAFVTTRGDRGGTGLGLSVVRYLVDQLDGVLEVETSPRGTTMSVWFSTEPEATS